MSEIKICGFILCILALCTFFKNFKSEYSLFIRIIATLVITGISISAISPILDYVEEITKSTPINTYLPILFKSLGISIIIHLTSDVCYDVGETSLGERIVLFGKIEILALSLPLIKELFNLAKVLI